VATGAVCGTLAAQVTVHLAINFHGLSEWKEKNRGNDQHKEPQHTLNNKGCRDMQISCLDKYSFT